MKIEIKIPSLGESVSEATISQILKQSGSGVQADEEIVELETEKVNQVLYAPKEGKLSLTVSVGQKVKVGEIIGFVDTEAKGDVAPLEKKETPAPKQEPQTPSNLPPVRVTIEERLKAPGKAQAPRPPLPEPSTKNSSRKKMSGLRKVIAERLVQVKNTTAMLTTFNEIDMSKVIEIRNKEKDNFLERYGVKLGFMSFFVKGVVAALKAYPQINAFIEGDEIVTFTTYDMGIAVSTEKGLMVPVVRDCETLSFGAIEQAITDFAKKAREGKITVDDLRGGTFTITNGGTFGSLLSTPILNPPQSGILGMHSIVKRPVAIEDKVEIRPMMYVALSYDHRLVDGREAVLFLVHLKETLEDPARLLLDL